MLREGEGHKPVFGVDGRPKRKKKGGARRVRQKKNHHWWGEKTMRREGEELVISGDETHAGGRKFGKR